MLTIGLTGGICSGKSTAGEIFMSQGITVIDADILAKKLCQPNEQAYQQIVAFFGPNCLHPNQHLNRDYLAHRIFNHPNEKQWLERCLHPKIRKRMLQEITRSKSAYTVCMIPLLAETMPHPYIKRILLIDVDPKIQIERLMHRNQFEQKEAKKRIAHQATRTKRLEIADDVIINQGSKQQLMRSILKKHELYLSLSQEN